MPTFFDSYGLLILTTDSLKSGFEPLKNAHDAKGLNTVIKTLTDVGSSDPEDIRDFIRDEYINNNIEYVLLGGDDDIVPARQLNVRPYPGTSPDVRTRWKIPAHPSSTRPSR